MSVTVVIHDSWTFSHSDISSFTEITPPDLDPAGSDNAFRLLRASAPTDAVIHEQPSSHTHGGPYYPGDLLSFSSYACTITLSAGAALAFVKTVHPLLLQWLKNRSSRSITVKLGNTEVSIKGDNDIGKALNAIAVLNGVKTEPEKNDPAIAKRSSKKRSLTRHSRGTPQKPRRPST